MNDNYQIPRIAQLRIGRNESFLSSWFLGILIPLFWLPSHILSALASGIMEIVVGAFAIVTRIVAMLVQYGILIACGACGMVVAVSAEEAADEIQDEIDD